MNWSFTKAKRVLAALLRIGWQQSRRSGSHRVLKRAGWPDFLFAFHDGDEIGPKSCSASASEPDSRPLIEA